MKRWSLSFLALTALAPPASAGNEDAKPLDYGDPISFHNITLIPVMSAETGPFQRYTLLETGLAKKTLHIRELNGQSDEATVAEVEVKNAGEQPVFLLGGEMILGGKQDRIIQADTVVPKDGKWHKVAVFCVEQGRWNGQKMQFAASGAVAHLRLQEAAMTGRQDRVWAEVARKNAEQGTSNETETYRRTIQNAKVRRQIASHRSELEKLLPSRPISGMIFAVNGEIQVADLMGNPPLFADLKEKLLSAYILEALEHQVDPKAPKLGKKAGKAFMDEAMAAPEVNSKASLGTRGVQKENAESVSNETTDLETDKKVRSTYIKKKRTK